ncbi:MAG: hypothetical protein KIS66_06570 [Fimbriimonadaceae bacterium]|nr:hypothetical protein [Fimbriimonadaceae bacterium]
MQYKREDRVGCLILLGVGLIVVGAVSSLLMFAGGVFRFTFTRAEGGDASMLLQSWAGVVVLVIGLAMTGAGYALGWRGAKSVTAPNQAPMRMPDVRVTTRFAEIPGIGMWFQDFDTLDDPKTRFVVQVELPTGDIREFQCDQAVCEQCGEGMVGEAIVQGGWMSSFHPYTGRSYRDPSHLDLFPPTDVAE